MNGETIALATAYIRESTTVCHRDLTGFFFSSSRKRKIQPSLKVSAATSRKDPSYPANCLKKRVNLKGRKADSRSRQELKRVLSTVLTTKRPHIKARSLGQLSNQPLVEVSLLK